MSAGRPAAGFLSVVGITRASESDTPGWGPGVLVRPGVRSNARPGDYAVTGRRAGALTRSVSARVAHTRPRPVRRNVRPKPARRAAMPKSDLEGRGSHAADAQLGDQRYAVPVQTFSRAAPSIGFVRSKPVQ